MGSSSKKAVQDLFAQVDINLDGKRPFDIEVKDERFYKRFLRDGRLALGESYMDGWWDVQRMDVLFEKILLNVDLFLAASKTLGFIGPAVKAKIFSGGSKDRAAKNVFRHYDLGNELFVSFLDTYMQYTCGYWQDANTLEEAQLAKMDLICKKLYLQPGMRVLDIGCGWGGFARYAAENYHVEVTGVTISKEQLEYAKKFCSGYSVELLLQDYRDVEGTFDRVVVAGMIEHVGVRNYRSFMRVIAKNLRDDGLFLLHTIGAPTSKWSEPWLTKYIFPGGYLPSVAHLSKAAEDLLIIEDLHNFGADYDQTLMAWFDNFSANWPQLKGEKYDERFFRMWTFYLLKPAGVFRARYNQLWQIVLSKKGVPGGYRSPQEAGRVL